MFKFEPGMKFLSNIMMRPADRRGIAPQQCNLFLLVACSSMTILDVYAGNNAPRAERQPTIKASSCAFEDVRSALSSLGHTGTVFIPAGKCDWGANQLIVPSGVALMGSGRDTTYLYRSARVQPNVYLIRYECKNDSPAVLADLSLVGAGLIDNEDRGVGLLNGCVDFEVSRSRFSRFVFAAIEVRGPRTQRGVIYDNEFIDNYIPKGNSPGYGIVVFGDATWPSLELGSENAVYIEDNYFRGNRHHIASNNGSRYVFRNNIAIATDMTKDFSQVDAHGLSSSPRGSRSWEIYNNQFKANLTSGRNLAGIGIRGGDGVIFGNTFRGPIAHPVLLSLEGGKCGDYPTMDQIRDAYIDVPDESVTNKCAVSIKPGRDYHISSKDGYRPFVYPHPLRNNPIRFLFFRPE